MQFLVQFETALPPHLPAEERAALLKVEAEHGRALVADGTITAIWRLPARLANVGIWDVDGPTHLHEAISSLPLWQWMTVTVTPLAEHPLLPTSAVP